MNVRFVSGDPREKARRLLDELLSRGIDQVAIACAFVTAAGAKVLRKHAANLGKAGSFLVAGWEPPTDEQALAELHGLFPGNVYIHLGAQTPVEKIVGRALMHSKVFFARDENRCWLWVGSHNLTANAVHGANLEAGVILEGTVDEPVFQDALAHLNQCKIEAILFDPFSLPPLLMPEPKLVIHAERLVNQLEAPPWFAHLRPTTTEYDVMMRPGTSVWLYLYEKGTLVRGQPKPAARLAYSGTITGLNLTDHHPENGTPADWQNATYIIEQRGTAFALSPRTQNLGAPSQCVFRINSAEDPKTIWLSKNPIPREEKIVGSERREKVDPDLRPFFTRQSLAGDELIHREYREMRRVVKVPRSELGSEGVADLADILSVPEAANIDIVGGRDGSKFEFIYRAKYRS